MHHHKKQLSLAVSTALGLTTLMAFPGYALAQDQQSDEFSDEMIEEVVVTGSRLIRQDGFGQTSPVAVIGMDDISSYGLTRIEDVLNNLPQIETSNNAFDSNGASGTASLDLRGLGAARTLVLLNGRRMQPGGINTQAVDVNQIPTMMIERVEVLTGGASATYGADAVAGVVNFIMRRIDGVEFRAGISAYQHNNDNDWIQGLMDDRGFTYPTGGTGFDGNSYNIEFAVGSEFADGRGNATAFATWRQNSELLQGERDYSSCAIGSTATSCGGSGTAQIPNFAIYAFDAEGGVDGGSGQYLTLQPDSSLADYDGNVFNYNPTNFYMRPQTSWTAGAFVDFELNEHAVVYLETMLANNETSGQIAFSGTFFSSFDLPVDNSLFPETFQDSLAEYFPGEDNLMFYIAKRNTEGEPRRAELTYSSFRIVTGVKGIINENWDYDVSYLHAQSTSNTTYLNDLYLPLVTTAVDGDACAATAGCIPYEVFTYQGVTAEAASSILGTASGQNRSSMDVFEAFVTGNTGYGLSAGDIIMAGGYNWLQTSFASVFDTIYQQGALIGQGGPRQDISGVIRANELFVEANIPLIADRSWSQMMSLDLAYRWSDFNTTGSASTYRVGIDWQVVDMFRVRTGYNRAVRAPNVGELFAAQNLGLWSGVDPCATADPIYSAEQCALTGVTPEQYGNISSSPADQYNGFFGGDPTLGVEKAKTFTFGIVLNPMDTMQLSIDYWDIKIDDTISLVQPEESINLCAETGGSTCANIHRGIGGTLWLGQSGWVDALTANIGTSKTTGIDLAWAWGLGDNWNFDLIGTYMLKKETTPIADDPSSAYDCAGIISPVCFPTPDWRHNASVTYDSESWWAGTLRWRYYGSVDYDGTTDTVVQDNTNAQNYIDLNAVFRFMDTHDVGVGVNNVFDKEPPLMGGTVSTNGNTVVGFWDTLGRYFYANVTLRW